MATFRSQLVRGDGSAMAAAARSTSLGSSSSASARALRYHSRPSATSSGLALRNTASTFVLVGRGMIVSYRLRNTLSRYVRADPTTGHCGSYRLHALVFQE